MTKLFGKPGCSYSIITLMMKRKRVLERQHELKWGEQGQEKYNKPTITTTITKAKATANMGITTTTTMAITTANNRMHNIQWEQIDYIEFLNSQTRTIRGIFSDWSYTPFTKYINRNIYTQKMNWCCSGWIYWRKKESNKYI